MSTLVGYHLDRFHLRAVIGEGGMAMVYLADHPQYGEVVIKLMQTTLGADRTAERRFMLEAKVSTTLRHPHIVRICAAGSAPHPLAPEQTLHYIAMEHIEGGTLAAWSERHGPCSLAELLVLGTTLGHALDYAHARGVIHCDMKPANVLIRSNGQLVISDFGIARSRFQTQVTQTHSLVGTIAYMAPELFDGAPPTPRTDLYALALILYVAATGHHPFTDTATTQLTTHRTIMRVLQGTIPPMRHFNRALPPAVTALIEQNLSRDPAKRHPSAGAFAAALAAACRTSTQRPRRRLTTHLAVTALGLTLLGGGWHALVAGEAASLPQHRTPQPQQLLQHLPRRTERTTPTRPAATSIPPTSTRAFTPTPTPIPATATPTLLPPTPAAGPPPPPRSTARPVRPAPTAAPAAPPRPAEQPAPARPAWEPTNLPALPTMHPWRPGRP